ncbi:MAG: amidohydrolase family protein [Acidimicrobiia bacterium]
MSGQLDLDHPIVDVDGHIVESIPLVVEYMRKVGGDEVADRFASSVPSFAARDSELLAKVTDVPDRAPGVFIPPWWSVAANALDRATAFLPALLHERLDEIGLDFSVLYSSVGLVCFAHPDDEIRRASCRGLNTYLAEVCDGFGDRLTPAAVIPSHTPDEAIAELEYAVHHLGLKAAVLNSYVTRTAPDGRAWTDVLALDSPFDYDPLWQRFTDLGVAVTVHSPTMGLHLRQSSSRYMFNHIGNFAASSDAFAKALVFGGTPHRFPTLNFGFLECGVAWGVQLLFDLVARWEKRGGTNIDALDPTRIDTDEWHDLVTRYGGARFADDAVRRSMLGQSDNPPAERDDFRASGARDAADLAALFDRFYFGCEADEGTVGWAFAADVNPFGAVLRPVLGSDIGHWDVPDMRDVVHEAYELVDDGRLDADQFRAFACDNPIQLHGRMNPAFFDGTPVEAHARTVLGPTREVCQ